MIFDTRAARLGLRPVRARAFLTPFILCLLLNILCACTATRASAAQPAHLNKLQIDRQFGHMPLAFEPNVGQTDKRVSYIAHGGPYTLFLTPSSAVLSLATPMPRASKSDLQKFSVANASLTLVGANTHPTMSATDLLPGHVNYLETPDKSKWHINVPTYGQVHYADIYPGVGLTYYGNNGRLEYDFTVAAHASAAPIALHLKGDNAVMLARNGDLDIALPNGQLNWARPVAYQVVDGKRQPVEASYTVKDGTVRVALGAFDHNRALVIDPQLDYSTYIPGGDVTGCAVDSSGDLFVAGDNASSTFPTSVGAFNTTSLGAFLVKINLSGASFLFATYFGDSGSTAAAISVDANNRPVVAGLGTPGATALLPVTVNAFQSLPGGAPTPYILVFNTSGTPLYCSYIGGNLGDSVVGVASSANGDDYLIGDTDNTGSTNFPTTAGAFETLIGTDPQTQYVACFNTASSTGVGSLVYSTLVGGTNIERPAAISADAAGDAYIVGVTGSTDYPITLSGFDHSFSGSEDAYLTELNPAGSNVLYSTFLNGSGFSYSPVSVINDSLGKAYVVGNTTPSFGGTNLDSSNGITVVGAYKIDTTMSGSLSLIYKSFFGGQSGSSSASAEAGAVDPSGRLTITGNGTNDLPLAGGYVQTFNPLFPITSLDPLGQVFLVQLNPSGTAVTAGTYLGDTGDYSFARGIASDSAGDIYVVGLTSSPTFNTTPGSAFQTISGLPASFALKVGFSLNPLIQINQLTPYPMVENDIAQTLTITGAGFTGGTTVMINGVAATPVGFGSPNTLTVTVPTTVTGLATTTRVPVMVTQGVNSASANLAMLDPNPIALFLNNSSIPDNRPAALNLTITGADFVPGTTVSINGQVFTNVFSNPFFLSLFLPTSALTTPGNYLVTVTNPSPATQTASLPLKVTADPNQPTITSLNPASVFAGSASIQLFINGTKFISTSAVTVGGVGYPVGFLSSNLLVVTLPASVLINPATLPVIVDNGSGSGGQSSPVNFSIFAPPHPTVSSISPTFFYAGSPSSTLTVNGSNFNAFSRVRINANDYPVNSGNPNTLTVTVPASLMATSGALTIKVDNGIDGGLSTSSQTLTIKPVPLPVLSGINPSSAPVGTTGEILTLTGGGFYPQSTVAINGSVVSPLTVLYESPTTLQVSLQDSLLTVAGTITVQVKNPSPDVTDGGSSAIVDFTVVANNPPTITSLNPAFVALNSTGNVITITGTNFSLLTTVLFNGTAATLVGTTTPTTIAANLPNVLTLKSGTIIVTVTNPKPGGGTASASLPVNQPVPTITTMSPNPYTLGSIVPLTITGTNFTYASTVIFNGGAPVNANVTGPGTLTVAIPNTLTANSGTVSVVVSNPSPGGGNSNPAVPPLTLQYPIPTLSGISPSTVAQGSTGQVLTLTGTGFAPGSSVIYNGNAGSLNSTTFISTTSISTIIPTSITANVGPVTVAVSNPTTNGGGGTTATQPLTITPIGIASLTLAPSTILGGQTSVATITLGSTAPAGGETVVITSDAPASEVVIPATVLVPSGTATMTFAVKTHVVSAQVIATITGTLGTTSQSAMLTLNPIGGGNFSGGLTFFSIPYAYTDLLANIFVTAPVPAQLNRYDPSLLEYDILVNPVTISPGIGYWAVFPSGGSSLNYLGTPASTTAPFVDTLSRGWNGIGDPFNAPVNVSNLTFTTTNITFANATGTAFHLISPTLYSFSGDPSGTGGIYVPVTSTQALVPGQGYWIYANAATTLNFPVPAGVITATASTPPTTVLSGHPIRRW